LTLLTPNFATSHPIKQSWRNAPSFLDRIDVRFQQDRAFY
jgi:hypothetical protein